MANTLEQLAALAAAGFTRDDIMQLIANNPQPVEKPVDNPAPAINPQPVEKPVDNPAPAINPQPVEKPVDNLTMQMWQTMQQMAQQQQAMLAQQQRQQINTASGGNPPQPATVDDVLANIINPPTK